MPIELAILRALLVLSRRRAPATVDDLLDRVGGEATDLQRALASLARSQLVQRVGTTARLSLAGLAVACAATANARRARRAKTVARPAQQRRSARVVPMVRRRRAAA